MNSYDTILYIDRTFLICGIIGILQVFFGHSFPILEGPAGTWWEVFICLIQVAKNEGVPLHNLLGELEMGLIIAGGAAVLLAYLGLLERVRRLFTPSVTGTFLVLLSLQLSPSLLGGIVGVDSTPKSHIEPITTIISILILSFTIWLMARGKGILKNFAVLVGLGVGWFIFIALGKVALPTLGSQNIIMLPSLFPWGVPRFNLGIVVTSVITIFVLMSNLIAAIQAMGSTIGVEPTSKHFERGTLITGIGTVLAGCFGTIGMVPMVNSASLVSLSGIKSRKAFLLSSIAIACLGFLPQVARFIITMPLSIGYDILFIVFAQLLSFGLKDFKRLAWNQRDMFIIGIPILAGAGLFYLPAHAWIGFPPIVEYLAGNGLIFGTLLVILMEHVIFRDSPVAK